METIFGIFLERKRLPKVVQQELLAQARHGIIDLDYFQKRLHNICKLLFLTLLIGFGDSI